MRGCNKEFRRDCAVWLAVILATGLFCSTASARLVNYVIHISVDGLRPDAITNLGPTNLPNFYRFRTEGAFTDNARTDYDYTVTLPNHTTQLTGRGVLGTTGHNWTGNTDPEPGATLASNKGSYVAGVCDVVHDNGLRTGIYANKSKFSLFDTSWNAVNGALDGTPPDNGRDKVDVYYMTAGSEPTVKRLATDMKGQPFGYAFIHIADLDRVGGWDPTPGSEYSNAVIEVDSRLGVIFDMIDTTPQFAGRTAVILTADHGGTPAGHNNAGVRENYTIPFYVWGPGVTPGADLYALNPGRRLDPGTSRPTYSVSPQPIRNGEAANVALRLLGLPAVPGSTINQAQNLAWSTSTDPVPPAPVASAATSVINCGFIAHWNSASGATGYLLDVATDSGFTQYAAGYRDVVVGNVVSLNVTGLNASTTYYYRVWAYNDNGTSGSSNTISVVTTANVGPPSAPIAAAASAVIGTGFTANWGIGCGATGYRLDVSTNAAFGSFVSGYQNLDVGNVTSRLVSGLNGSTTYYYRVRAYNGSGSSGDSEPVSVTTADINFCIPGVLLGHGDMEDSSTVEYSVCPDWAPYSAGPGAASWAKEQAIVHGGSASQRTKNINGQAGSLIGVYQTIDANVGDAFTFEGWVYPETNPAYAQAAMAARWDGSTTIPDGTASWKISGATRLVWSKIQGFSGNATADRVTLFLDSRHKSGSVSITAYWDDVVSYRAYVPPPPTVSVASSTSLIVDVNAGCNSTNIAAQFAVTIGGGGYTLGTHWVQANGSIGTTAAWQTDAAWATVTIGGLTTGTTYSFKEKARYSSTRTQETSLGGSATITVGEVTPVPPTITQHPSDQTVLAGETATFTVVATGTAPLAYQWQANQINITDGGGITGSATTTLQIPDCQLSDEADYRCVVTNNYGTATSNAASLTVVACSSPVLLNGGFEGGNTGGVGASWTAYQRAPNPITVWSIQTASPPAGGGLQYQQIANTSSTGGGGVRQDVTGCAVGATYTIAGWMRTNSPLATCRVRCSPTASTSWNTAVDLNPAQFTTSSSWVPFSGTVIATGTSMTIWLDGQTGGEDLNKASCFDSVTVTTNTAPPATPTVSAPPSVCAGSTGNTATIMNPAGGTYSWTIIGGTITAGAASSTVTYTAGSGPALTLYATQTACGLTSAQGSKVLTVNTAPPTDFDGDCDVDSFDVSHLTACLSGPQVEQVVPACQTADLDQDGDIDQDDFGIVQRCYTGENSPADSNCAD